MKKSVNLLAEVLNGFLNISKDENLYGNNVKSSSDIYKPEILDDHCSAESGSY